MFHLCFKISNFKGHWIELFWREKEW